MGRQNWRATSTLSVPASCQPYVLPSGLTIPLASSTTYTLTTTVSVTPACFSTYAASTTRTSPDSPETTVVVQENLRDEFYASSIPMAYSISATSTLAFILLFLLFLPTPPNRRPGLQKVATLSVCVCLVIAYAETTSVLRREYYSVGSSVYSIGNEARIVRERVVGGLVMKIGRVVSDLFLWLAQVQTLIRLFPREREKAVIKYAGFCLILLDTLFSILQSFVSPLGSPDSFLDAIPALSYLFQISLSLLYASCVVWYSVVKRRYAYFHPHHPAGRRIFLIAALGIAAVLTPIVFFIVDIAQKDLAGWGDYIRWVGAASASVVVWEWVDRIEMLEREERKRGVLGRVVYEEDDDDDGGHHEFRYGASGEEWYAGDAGRGGSGARSAEMYGGSAEAAATTETESSRYGVQVRMVATNEMAAMGLGGASGTWSSGDGSGRGGLPNTPPDSPPAQHGAATTEQAVSPPPPPPPMPQPAAQGGGRRWPWERRRRRRGDGEGGVNAGRDAAATLGGNELPVVVVPPPQRRRREV